MNSYWGVDHGVEIRKSKTGKLLGSAAVGAGAGYAADKIMTKTDKDYKAKARKDPVTLAAVGGSSALAAGSIMAGPRVGLGLGAGTAGSLYAMNRKRKSS